MADNIKIQNRQDILPRDTGKAKEVALDLLETGINSCLPERVLRNHLTIEGDYLVSGGRKFDLENIDRIIVLGAGKASGGMAKAIFDLLGSRIEAGLVITKNPGKPSSYGKIELVEGSHPVPSTSGVRSTKKLLKIARSATKSDLVICLISGGGSSLLTFPQEGIVLGELIDLTGNLLESGASIEEINSVRKWISGVKGGRLAREIHPAKTLSLIISDVVGDNLKYIASGPTVPDNSTPSQALVVLEKYDLRQPRFGSILKFLEKVSRDDPKGPVIASEFNNFDVTNRIIASNKTALSAISNEAEKLNINYLTLSSRLVGESREVGKVLGQLVRSISEEGSPLSEPALLLSGGETTVNAPGGTGKGGPNQEFTLWAGLQIVGIDSAYVGAIDSDGEDGSTKIAGGLITGNSMSEEDEIIPYLENHESSRALKSIGGGVVTGPTGTNVNDIRLALVI